MPHPFERTRQHDSAKDRTSKSLDTLPPSRDWATPADEGEETLAAPSFYSTPADRKVEEPDVAAIQPPGYEIERVLGRGGMGVVYLARQTSLRRPVALKMILAGPLASQDVIARFRREAEAVARLSHPNIIQIFEIGECDGRPFFAMEYVPGGDLDHRYRAALPEPREAASLVEWLARAMHAVHQVGIVHRDLKPANVLLTPDGIPKISDFGLAKPLEDDDERLTPTDAVVGTPSYMAPEQASSGDARFGPIGPAADIYALGAILYKMLTGRPPFLGDKVWDTVHQVLSDDPVAPRRLQPKVPRDLETICLKCLAKDPTRRYASALELADDLARYLRSEPIRARPVSAWERGAKWAKRHPAVSVSVGSLAALVLAILAVLTFANRALTNVNAQLAAERDEADQFAAHAFATATEFVEFINRDGAAVGPLLAPEQRAGFKRAVNTFRTYLAHAKRSWPHQTEYREILAACYWQVGALEAALEQPEAEGSLKQGLALYEELLATDPLRSNYQDGAASCCYGLAEMYGMARRWSEAEQFLDRAEAYAQTITASPARIDLLSRIQTNRGLAQAQMGRYQEAETALRDALKLISSLPQEMAEMPATRARQARALYSLGLISKTGQRIQEADVYFRQAVDLQRSLVTLYGGNRLYRQELVHSLVNHGEVLWLRGNMDEAGIAYEEAVQLARGLARLAPAAETKMDLGLACYHQANLAFAQKKNKIAEELLRESIENIREGLDDSRAEVRPLLLNVCVALTQVLLAQGAHAEAYQMIQESVPLAPKEPAEIYHAALYIARCAALVSGDSSLTESDRERLLAEYGDAAIKLLQEAVSLGFEDPRQLTQATEWAPLRQRDDFQEVLAQLNAEKGS